MSLVLTTASVHDRDKIAYWRDAVGRTLGPTAVAPRGDGPFSGRITTDRLGCLQVSTMEADAKRVSRTPELIARSSGAYTVVGIQVSGTATLVQDGRRAEVGEGDLVVYDTTRPYSFDYPDRFSTHVFQVPRRVLGVPGADLRRITGTAIGPADGLGVVLLPFLRTLATSAHAYSPVVGAKLADSVIDLLGTLVAERTRQVPTDTDATRALLVRRVRSHIDRNLGDPDLSPEDIAKTHRISVRYLHRLFEGEGITVARFVQQRRLEECARELARRGRTTPTVSAVAQRWGFVSPSHFSRTFRAAYGLSPREWRSLRTVEDSVHGVAEGGDGPRRGVPPVADLPAADHQ
ncbi:helix-turn-helix domain-containing protein [Streptomyces sp. NBC_01275]|uniref:AraC-like ligand-binding domain-containing protein n=1 Tax=Streptomyces sp. NBC_01275 TaxID=2903807 RepID=UPI00225A3137|nr:helix-turn-helix domain-containing protein [Streptomyces sp. NBC_01275]MCX4767212.1 helix-turn-helix domain-containing protein [Streptomyces sp. NBC_01275]